MQFFNEKKDKKEIKTDNNCIFCGRKLTYTDIFHNGNYDIICKIKYQIKKPNATLNDKIIR